MEFEAFHWYVKDNLLISTDSFGDVLISATEMMRTEASSISLACKDRYADILRVLLVLTLLAVEKMPTAISPARKT
jgi:hypothetical protein